ncbi:MAG TPA: hypothetical protein P5121_31470 [Caldilineaceae bacterium]|mgnify:CR=1 FL=1|nr:hypothetical protein [Caldilineaceae bacterium]HRW09678.1 hypothetical protein [Caldilineaceae bacterium]
MAQTQIKEKLNVLIDSLPTEQAELVLDFAVLLRQRQAQAVDPNQTAIEANPWETALADAETYWFQLSEATRSQYKGKTVAILHDQILDSDVELAALRERVTRAYPDQPVLYLPADAEQLPPLFVRGPRFQ